MKVEYIIQVLLFRVNILLKQNSEFRHIISPASSAKENMAIDEALLKCFDTHALPILRFYTWQPDSMTVGISQDIKSYSELNREKERMAKRVTGGGVLFHGHDVSYSLIIPGDSLQGLSIKESYEYICRFLLAFYRDLGLEVCYAKDDATIQLSKSEYCQVGFEAYDILVNGQKIGGNAQRRAKKVIFQHGSIPVKRVKNESLAKEIGISLEDLGISQTHDEVIKRLGESFRTCFQVNLNLSVLNHDEIAFKNSILKTKEET